MTHERPVNNKTASRAKMFLRLLSHIITIAFCLSVLLAVSALFTLKTYLLREGVENASLITSFLNAFQIKVFELVWNKVAMYLSDLENYRTLERRRDALVWKMFLFRAINAFGSSLWLAFVLHCSNRNFG